MKKTKFLLVAKYSIIFFTILLVACNNDTQVVAKSQQEELIFSRGKKITNNNFIGAAWLNSLVVADSINRNAVGSVTFAPGGRTSWHSHPNGQIILVIGGKGYYQEKGSAKRILHKGDVVKCPPNVPHWHGASADKELIQIAITSRQDGPTKWMEPVTKEAYEN